MCRASVGYDIVNEDLAADVLKWFDPDTNGMIQTKSAVAMDPFKHTMKAVPIPPEIRAKIEVAPPELFFEEKKRRNTH